MFRAWTTEREAVPEEIELRRLRREIRGEGRQLTAALVAEINDLRRRAVRGSN